MKRSSILLTLGGLGFATWAISRSVRSDFSFAGKVVLITGGSRGLGFAIARKIATEGGRVALLARDEDELARACQTLRKLGGDALAVPCDLLDRGQSLGAIETVVDHFGALDVLINNAGIIEVGPLENMRRHDFEKSMQVHFWAPFNLIRQVVPHMRRAGGGRIINFSDWVAASGRPRYPGYLPYYVAKAGAIALTEALALELASDHILVNAIAPGPIVPPPGTTDEEIRAVEQATPLGRWGGAEAIVRAVLFLVETDFVTGETIRVDGGRHIK